MAWTDALSDEERGYYANKGWDKLAPEAAAAQIGKSYRELERLRPEAPPREYTFEGLKNPDGSAPEADVLEMVRGLASELKLPAGAATTLATRLIAIGADAEKAEADATAARIAASETALKTTWGADYDEKVAVATRGLTAAGYTKEETDALITTLGVDKVMARGYDLGTKLGEAQLHQGSTTVDNKQGAPLTRDTALATRNGWGKDFFDKWQAGDAAAVKEFEDVTKAIIGGTPENFQPAPENFGRQGDGHGREIFPGSEKWKG
jgi:hypothetical protein